MVFLVLKWEGAEIFFAASHRIKPKSATDEKYAVSNWMD